MCLGRPKFYDCKGWTDEYGNWNTGFKCPMWGGEDEEYCCGTVNNRFCCSETRTVAPTEETNS